MPVRIIEIKARCADPGCARDTLMELGARHIGVDHQVDTYFAVPEGRLKLRQGNIENTLIFYHRPNQAAPKQSDVQLYRPGDAGALARVLEAALQVLVVVDKQREIFFIDHIKFHIDQVKGLGSFIEIEVIDEDRSMDPEMMRVQCDEYMRHLAIAESDLQPDSYSDMLLRL